MARTHFWSFLTDSNGTPLEQADVTIYLAGTEEIASIYTGEFSTIPIKSSPHLKTNSLGYFEFWIADSSDERAGYANTQKFKIVAKRVGIADLMIDYIDILAAILPVDPSSDNTIPNKAISNAMAKQWNSLLVYQGMPIGRPGDSSIPSDDRNKFVSNNMIALWQNHRKMCFNDNIPVSPNLEEGAKLPWEDMEMYPSIYGAHGIQTVSIDGIDRSDTTKNKLVSNYIASGWEEHKTYSFKDHDISEPGYSLPTAHGLYRADISIPPFDLDDPNAPFELVREYNQYNKLVSNRLMREILYESEIKVSLTARKISKADWNTSEYEQGIYYYKINHNLNTRFIGLQCFRKIERINPETGVIDILDSMYSPEDVFIINDNEIEIHSNIDAETFVTIWGRRDLKRAMNEESNVGGGSGATSKFRLIFDVNVPGAQVRIKK